MNNGSRLNNKEAGRVPYDSLSRLFGNYINKVLLFTLLFLICLFILYPIACIFLHSFQSSGRFSLGNYIEVWKTHRVNLRNSMFTAILTSVICTFLSVCVTLFTSTRKGKGRLLCIALLLIAMVSPHFVSSISYIQLYGHRGWISYRLLGLSWNPYDWWGVVWMQSISFVPMNVLILSGLLAKLDTKSIHSARDLGAGLGAVLNDMILPIIRPGFLVCLLISFVRSLADFITPVIIGGQFSTLASEIYLQVVGGPHMGMAAAMNIFLMVPAIAAFFLYWHLIHQSDFSVNRMVLRQKSLDIELHKCGILGGLSTIAGWVFYIMMALQYACIFSSGFLKELNGTCCFTTEHLEQLMKYDNSTMARSIKYALIVSILCTLFAMCFSYYKEKGKIPRGGFWDCISSLPCMLPGSCLGIAYILAFSSGPLKLTGGALIVIASMLFMQLPISAKIFSASLSQIPKHMELTVKDLGGGRQAVFFDVVLPWLRPAFIRCFAYNFLSSMTTAEAILFLVSPRKQLAISSLFNAAYSGEYVTASLIATLIILIVLIVEAIAYIIMRTEEKRYVS